MTDMAKYPGLMRRGTKWYLRATIPADLVEAVGKREIWRSLDTGDHKKAVGRYKKAIAQVEDLKDAARRKLRKSDAHVGEDRLRKLAVNWFHSNASRSADADHCLSGPDRRTAFENTIEDLDALLKGDEHEWGRAVQGQADTLLKASGIQVDKSGVQYMDLCDYVRRAMVEDARRSLSRLSVDRAEAVFDPAFASATSGLAVSDASNCVASPTLTEVVSQFLDDPSRNAGDKANLDYRVVLRFLSEFVDPEAPISAVERSHCRAVATLLRRMPANASKKKVLRGLEPLEVAERAEQLGIPPMSPTTANSYISKMSTLFRWAVREGLLHQNPAEGLLLREETHRRDARLPFSLDQLKKILASEPFREHVEKWNHRQWVFLLGLYGGLRLNEACGLTCDDVVERDGVSCLLVRPTGCL